MHARWGIWLDSLSRCVTLGAFDTSWILFVMRFLAFLRISFVVWFFRSWLFLLVLATFDIYDYLGQRLTKHQRLTVYRSSFSCSVLITYTKNIPGCRCLHDWRCTSLFWDVRMSGVRYVFVFLGWYADGVSNPITIFFFVIEPSMWKTRWEGERFD